MIGPQKTAGALGEQLVRLAQAPKRPRNRNHENSAAHEEGDQTLKRQVSIELLKLDGDAGPFNVELGNPNQPVFRAGVQWNVHFQQRHRLVRFGRVVFGQKQAR